MCVSEDEVAGEVDEAPLAAGFDLFDGAAGDGRVVVDAGEGGKAGLEGGDELAADGALHGAGGSVDGVAFRHSLIVAPRAGARHVPGLA